MVKIAICLLFAMSCFVVIMVIAEFVKFMNAKEYAVIEIEEKEKDETSIKVARKTPEVKLPCKAHASDAGFDFFVPDDVTIPAHGMAVIDTQIYFQVPLGWELRMCSKSGLMARGVTCMGGEIDHGYSDTIKAALRNETDDDFNLYKGMKFVQGILTPIGMDSLKEVPISTIESESTVRGKGGFGSTGA